MAKVVGRDESAIKRITCRSCALVLEYTLTEVKSYHSTDYGGGPDGKEWVDCPNCGAEVLIRNW